MKLIKTILMTFFIGVLLTLSSVFLTANQVLAESPPPYIYEVHPYTLYLVTLEYQETLEDLDIYDPIGETPQHSIDICEVKPSACYKPVYIPNEPGDNTAEK